MRIAGFVLGLTLAAAAAQAKDFDAMFPGHAGYEQAEVNDALRSFDYKQGTVRLPGGQATLEVPNGFYYLNPEDAHTVLTSLWDNPNGDSLGMIFPSNYTPWDYEAWGATFQFEDIGYVSDDDAEGYDYADLLADMQADTRRDSRARVDAGYDAVDLVGWAEPPSYDTVTRKLHWAMELHFGDMDTNTLNYEFRALGREGVLSANFIAGMEHLSEIKADLPQVAGMISFNDGKTYADFDPSLDTVAAVGVAGLVAGKALNSKTGLVAAALLLLKKFWFILLLPFVWLKNLFRRKD